MSEIRIIEFDLNSLLALLVCSEYYEFEHDILYHTILEKIGDITDDDIESYIKEYGISEDGEEYSEDDKNNIREYLKDIRSKYINEYK